MRAWLRKVFRIQAEHEGATAEYAVSLHDIHNEIDERTEIAARYSLDILRDAAIIEEVIKLRLSMAERLEHARARWERYVEPLRLALISEVPRAT